jgi:hypothetical protein
VAVALTAPAVAVALKLCHDEGSIQSHESRFTTLNADGSRLITGGGSVSESTACRANAVAGAGGVPPNAGEAVGIHERAPFQMVRSRPGQWMKYHAPGVGPPAPKVAASLAGIGVYVQDDPEPALALASPPCAACPGVADALAAPTFTVFPPSDAEPEFDAAQATNAPWVPMSTATVTKTFDRRVTRPPFSPYEPRLFGSRTWVPGRRPQKAPTRLGLGPRSVLLADH